MIKKETFEVMKSIEMYFPNFSIEQKKIDLWHKSLKDYEFDVIMGNLSNYAEENKFPPSLSDLLSFEPMKGRGVKTVEETRAMMDQWEKEQPKERVDPKTIPGWVELKKKLLEGLE